MTYYPSAPSSIFPSSPMGAPNAFAGMQQNPRDAYAMNAAFGHAMGMGSGHGHGGRGGAASGQKKTSVVKRLFRK
jgi:hypothetical protein